MDAPQCFLAVKPWAHIATPTSQRSPPTHRSGSAVTGRTHLVDILPSIESAALANTQRIPQRARNVFLTALGASRPAEGPANICCHLLQLSNLRVCVGVCVCLRWFPAKMVSCLIRIRSHFLIGRLWPHMRTNDGVVIGLSVCCGFWFAAALIGLICFLGFQTSSNSESGEESYFRNQSNQTGVFQKKTQKSENQ